MKSINKDLDMEYDKFKEEYKIGSEISLRINTDALIELPK